MTQITMHVATKIAHAWLNEVPLHKISEETKLDYVTVMDAVRQMRLPDRHPATRKVYERGGFVD